MRIIDSMTKWLFILCLPILLITASIGWVVNNLWLYENGFEKYQISQKTGLAKEELNKAAKGLIGYFNSDEKYISLTVLREGQPFELFNQREVVHLKDVKELIWFDYRMLLSTLIYILGYAGVNLFRRNWQRLTRVIFGGSVLTLTLMLILLLGALLDFEQLFWQFHLISFANDFWQLNPVTDYLIMLFPQGFWYDVSLFIGLITAGLAVFLGGGATLYFKIAQKPTS
ncbi:TIGR01906 family membrane protein [Chloroflexota bacterium]